MPDCSPQPLERRSFLSRLGAGLGALSGALIGSSGSVGAQSVTPPSWSPARHAQDDWFDQLPGKHRFFFDATTAVGAGDAITFASNFYTASRTGYGLTDADNAVVIGLRHHATPFALTDAMWAKYGSVFHERLKFLDPKTQQPPLINVYQDGAYGMQLSNRGTTLSAMIARGTHFAICDMATRAFAGMAATKLSLRTADVYEEFKAHAIPNTHFMAAGIVAVNRAQERGYAIQHIG
jgi:hypothetical protein